MSFIAIYPLLCLVVMDGSGMVLRGDCFFVVLFQSFQEADFRAGRLCAKVPVLVAYLLNHLHIAGCKWQGRAVGNQLLC